MKFDIMSAIKDEIAKMEENSKESAFDNVFLDYVEQSIDTITKGEFPEFYELKLSEVLPIDKRNELNLVLINKYGDKYNMLINENGYVVNNNPSNIFVEVKTSNFDVTEEHSTEEIAFTFVNDIVRVKKTIAHTIDISVYQNAARDYDGDINAIFTVPYLIPSNTHSIKSKKSGKTYIYEASTAADVSEDEIKDTSRWRLDYLRRIGMHYCSHCQREDDFTKLEKRIEELGMNKDEYVWYMNLRKYGTTMHSGFGMGFERLIMYMTGMSNIRDVSAFPRTPGNCLY